MHPVQVTFLWMNGNVHLNPSVVGQVEVLEDGDVGRRSEIIDGVINPFNLYV